jgi:hypothetical protein
MSEGKIRGKILVELWALGKPMTVQALAEKIGLASSSTMGYLLGLIKAKYVSVPQKHYYAITEMGKKAIGIPKLDKKLAQCILTSVHLEKAFHFYSDIDNYLGIYATNLKDFSNKLQMIDVSSVVFHLTRKDFENWIRSLGDVELSKRLTLIRASKLSGEKLRNKLQETINSRYEELKRLLA